MPNDPITRNNWLYAPHNRWSFQHVQAFVPTMRISRGIGTPRTLERGAPFDPQLRFGHDDITYDLPMALQATDTDALVILRDGQLIHESYANGMAADSLHLLMSCTKSYVGMLTGIVHGQGLLNLDETVAHYLPALAHSSFGPATLQQLLDMNAGAAFNEDYADPSSDINVMDYAIGWRPAPAGYRGPQDMLTALQLIRGTAFEDGDRFDYRSALTDVLGLVLEAVSNRPLAELISHLLWRPLGCEYEAVITVDQKRRPLANGGLCTTARDFARFGQLVLDEGAIDGDQLVPRAWVLDTRHGDADSIRAWQASSYVARAPHGNYRNQWWCRDHAKGILMASGIHGQSLYIDPTTSTVIAKFSSQPLARDDATFALQFALLEAIAASE